MCKCLWGWQLVYRELREPAWGKKTWISNWSVKDREKHKYLDGSTVVNLKKRPPLYIMSRLYTSSGAVIVLSQDFKQTRSLFAADAAEPLTPTTTVILPHLWVPCTVRMHNTRSAEEKEVCWWGNSAVKNCLKHSPRSKCWSDDIVSSCKVNGGQLQTCCLTGLWLHLPAESSLWYAHPCFKATEE